MAEQKQYLHLTIAGASYLLPSANGYTIEQRDNLMLNHARGSNVVAWRMQRNQRAPVYILDRNFNIAQRDDWQRAVFIGADANAVGVVVDDVYLMPKANVAPFAPLGPAPTKAGHLFSGASAVGQDVVLVLDPTTFSAYLLGLGE